MGAIEIEGLDKLKIQLSKLHAAELEERKKALTMAALMVKADAVKRAPVDTGNLRGSAFTEVDPTEAVIGFSASYAAAVHEDIEMKLKGQKRRGGSKKGVYWEAGEPKFLERAFDESRKRILSLFASAFDKSIKK